MDLETPPTKDFPLLWKVYDHIVAHPEEWIQSLFVNRTLCGTTFCFAGHTVLMMRPDAQITVAGNSFVDSDGEPIHCEDEARRLLGLTFEEANALFYNFTSDSGDIRDMIAKWEASA